MMLRCHEMIAIAFVWRVIPLTKATLSHSIPGFLMPPEKHVGRYGSTSEVVRAGLWRDHTRGQEYTPTEEKMNAIVGI